jgi:hypothetical protein
VSAHLIVPEDGGPELAVKEISQRRADSAKDLKPSQHRFSGLLGLGLILLIVFCALYFALRYMM